MLSTYIFVFNLATLSPRYADKDISTHDRQTLAAVSATQLQPLKSIAASSYSVIGIDEGQFVSVTGSM